LDGRVAQPLWLASTEGLLHVRAMHAHGAATRRFDLWRIPGRKRLSMDGHDLELTADLSALRMRLSLSGTLEDGGAYVGTVPLTPGLRGQLDGYREQAQALEGLAPQIPPVRTATRAALLHLRALQALDARPLLELEMRLGEGSGAAVATNIVRSALAAHDKMATLAEAAV